jgi:hypothetical protein
VPTTAQDGMVFQAAMTPPIRAPLS